MIPKIIHYVWLGKGKKSPLFEKCLKSWKEKCPDYQIIEWNETNFDFSCSRYAREAYEQKKYGFVPDYIRAKVLYDHGGIYLDTDVEIVKSFDSLLEEDFLISFENGAYLETAILGSCKGHPFAKMMADFYIDKPYIENGKIDFTPSTPIWTHFINKHYKLKLKNSYQKLKANSDENAPTITVFPSEYFCPINFTTKKLKQTENTYAIHYFSATWFTGKLKTREKLLKAVYYTVGEKIFTTFTRTYAKSVGRKIEKHLKRVEKMKKTER